jgi:hypothetical protein
MGAGRGRREEGGRRGKGRSRTRGGREEERGTEPRWGGEKGANRRRASEEEGQRRGGARQVSHICLIDVALRVNQPIDRRRMTLLRSDEHRRPAILLQQHTQSVSERAGEPPWWPKGGTASRECKGRGCHISDVDRRAGGDGEVNQRHVSASGKSM